MLNEVPQAKPSLPDDTVLHARPTLAVRVSAAIRDLQLEPAAGSAGFAGGTDLQNREVRRTRRFRDAAEQLLRDRRFSIFMKATSWITTAAMLHMIFATTPGSELAAQPFNTFEERNEQDAEQYVDRARRLNDAAAWTNYVELGIASEFIEWEEEALEDVRNRFQAIDDDDALDDAQKDFEKNLISAEYNAAALAWEADAEDFILEQRGEYRAETAAVTVDPITEAEYAQMVADAEATLAGAADLDLAGWDAAIDLNRDALVTRFEDSLTDEMNRVRSENTGLTGDELAVFEQALNAREAELRQEFLTRDHFYVLSARNSYVAELRADDVSARLFAEQSSASNTGDQIIADAANSISTQTNDLMDEANASITDLTEVPDFDPALLDDLAGSWEAKMEAVVDAGLRRWEQAEEQLYSQRLAWLNETKRTREEGERIWESNHEKLKAARTTWLEELNAKVEEGRLAWQAKFAEFNQSRATAELELQDYVNEEQARRDAALDQLGDLVRGGGGALAEARDAYYYYTDLLANMQTPAAPYNDCLNGYPDNNTRIYCFYVEQRDSLAGSLGRFQQILADAEGVLVDNMHSNDNSNGFLQDRRLYAGTLPDDVAAIAVGDFRNDLEALITSRPDDFLLYQRDMLELIDRNALFTSRATDLEGVFDYASAGSVDDLRAAFVANNADGKYDDHAREIEAILAEDRSALADDAARLAPIKTDIAAWFTTAKDENVRLKERATGYFSDGLGGYYLSGNENDPYLMTSAEYEWELLRRERIYLAKRLHRAEAVKRYAEVAAQFEAGLELAQVTAERTDIAKQRSDLRELSYMLIKGDLALDPLVQTDTAVRDAEFTRLLSERGIDPVFLAGREADLNDERDLLNDVASIGTPTAGNLGAVLADIDTYLNDRVAEDARAQHRLAILRDKLLDLRSEILAGADAGVVADKWTVIGGGAGALRDEVTGLIADYDFADLNNELNRVRLAVGEARILDLREAVYTVRDAMDQNATDLAAARVDLDLAKERYRDALIDLQVLQAGNSQELIKIDVVNNTRQLAAVLNRMEEIQSIPGFENTVHDALSEARIDHLYTISEGERARKDFAAAEGLLRYVQGLENAKDRLAALNTLLGANNLNAMSVADRADLVLANLTDLVDQSNVDESMRSMNGAITAANTIAGLRGNYDAQVQAVVDAIANGETLAEIELKRQAASDTEFRINQAIEVLFVAIRGEERARRIAITEALGGPALDEAAIFEEWNADQSELGDRAYARGEDVAAAIQSFLNANREQSFGQLLQSVNANIATLQNARGVRTAASFDGSGLIGTGPLGSVDLEIQNALRSWLIANQASIDYANETPVDGAFDRRGPAEKWDSLLEFAGDLVDDATFYDDFAANMPDSASDAWVVSYTSDRTALLGRLDAVLGNTNAALPGAYGAMTAADRDVLLSYGGVRDDFGAADLRGSLEGVRQSLAADIAAVSGGDYRNVYLRETQIEQERELRDASIEYNELSRRLSEDRSEEAELQRNRDDYDTERAGLNPVSDAARIAVLDGYINDLDNRLSDLAANIAALEANIAAPEARMRAAQNHLREIQQPGSTAPLLAQIDGGLGFERVSFESLSFQLQLLDQQQSDLDRPRRETSADQVKAVIGFYRTDAAGAIMRDASGVPLVSQEFIDLGYTDPAMDLATALSGNQTGPNLERWSERLVEWVRVQESQGVSDPSIQADPEVVAAVRQLEQGISDLLAARAFIENRAVDAATLETQASDDAQRYGTLTGKLVLLIQFESDLANAIYQAEQNGGDAAGAALQFLEQYENRHIYQLFNGFTADGSSDGVVDAELQERVYQLQQLAERLRTNRRESAVSAVAAQYGAYMEQYLGNFAVDNTLRPASAADFISGYPELDGAAVVAAVSALPAADFRTEMWNWLNTNPAAAALYRSEVVAALQANAALADGALQTAVINRLNAYATDVADSLAVLTGDIDARTVATRDSVVTDSVASFIAAYNTRGDYARNELVVSGLIAGVADATTLGTAQGLLANIVNAELEGAMYNDVRLALIETIFNASTDTATLKADLTAQINALVNTAATSEFEDELYAVNLRRSLAVMGSQDSYNADDYPAELRDFLLVREYTRAYERYDSYLAGRSADTQAEQAVALDLRGLNGDFARAKLREDFATYLAANDYVAYLNAPENKGKRGVGDYIAEYMVDRNTSTALLGPAAEILYVTLAQMEYQRLNTASAGNFENVNESDYAGEFKASVIIAYVTDYMARNALMLTGASAADRETEFAAIFESVLDDAAYTHGGESLRQRMLAGSEREFFQNLTFARIEAGTPAEQYLPSYLDELRIAAELLNPVKTANDYFPAELLAIAGYAAADYKAMASAIDARYGDELARVEIYAGAEFDGLALYATPTEVDAIIARSDYDGVISAALRSEIQATLANRALASQLQANQVSTIEQALALARQERVLNDLFPATADQQAIEIFFSGEGERFGAIEREFFRTLEGAHGDLRDAVRGKRGDVIAAVIARAGGGTTAYYSAQSAEMQAAIDSFQTDLWAELNAAQQSALTTQSTEYQNAFELRGAQELAGSQIFAAFEGTLFAYINRAADDAQLATARENKAGLLKAYLESIQAAAGTGSVSAASTALLGSTGLATLISDAVAEVATETQELVARESALITRYLNAFQEIDAERAQLLAILEDSALIDPFAAKAIGYDNSLEQAQFARESQELTAALSGTVQDHSRYFVEQQFAFNEAQQVAVKLREFASQRGDDGFLNRFANYRTFIDTSRGILQTDFDASGDPDFEDWANGLVLASDSLGIDPTTLFANANWEGQLISDDVSSVNDTVDVSGVMTEIRNLRVVNDVASREAVVDNLQRLAYIYQENLANNYLDAVSRLNSAFNNVFIAAGFADERHSTPADERIAAQIAGYNPNAAAGTNDLTALNDARSDALARQSANGDVQIQQKQQAIGGAYQTIIRNGEEFADAGRRAVLNEMNVAEFLNSVFQPIADDFETARIAVEDLATIEETLRTDYATANQNLVNGLNDMAKRYRSFSEANDEYEMRLSIQDYAETPYLLNVGTDENANIEDWANNAREEYERAVLVMGQHEERMDDARFAVLTQDNLGELYIVATEIEGGTNYAPLDAAEQTELAELQERKHRNGETLTALEETRLTELLHREMAAQYGELINRRTDHIKHTMRMIRIHKAREIINAEVAKREAIAEEKKRQFDTAVGNFLGGSDVDARNAVYQRLAAQAEAGNFNYVNEFKAWFWGQGAWQQAIGGAAQGLAINGGFNVTPSQILEAAGGQVAAASVPPADALAIGQWMQSGGGLAEYFGWQGIYTTFMMSLMNHDIQLVRNIVVTSAMTTLIGVTYATLSGLLATAAFNPFVYPQITASYAAIALATSQIVASNAMYILALTQTLVMGAMTVMGAEMPRITGVMQKQYEYEEAQAALNYFTKVPDVTTLKERVIQWGANPDVTGDRKDPYAITEEDLIYLFEDDAGGNPEYRTSTGAVQLLDAEQQSEALNLTGFSNNTEYKDIYGRVYDPTTIIYGVNQGRQGGFYYHNGEAYVRIQTMGHDGALTWAYAKHDTGGAQRRVFNISTVMDMTVQHGQDLRDQRRDAYLAAGGAAATDNTFLYQERDATAEQLFLAAGAEGRSYTGYRMTYEDYESNQRDVFGAELQQRQQVQLTEWALREQELTDRYEEWERKMATLMERGRSEWGNAENRFLQEWREWERQVDKQEEEGKARWDEQIAEHFTNKEQWEIELRNTASEQSIREVLTESINDLNSQILMVRDNIRSSTLQTINTTAYVNNAVAELQALQPSFSESFADINRNIENFNTTLSISELVGTDLTSAVDAIGAQYREELRLHEKNMQVQAKVKVFEEYRRMFDELAFQIQLQNDAIAQQTAAAAMAQGFAPSGATFIKVSQTSGIPAIVNAYTYFEAQDIIRDEMKKTGFENKEGDELVTFLEEMDDVEVEAYFYTQRLALQNVFDTIMGSGTAEDRVDSKDEEVIGKFGVWAGRQPGSDASRVFDQASQVFTGNAALQNSNYLTISRNHGGFGEQGSFGPRPSGIGLGFYPQLDIANQIIGQADARGLANSQTTLDPMSTLLNQWNPAVMLANSYQNVELAAASGADRGYMWEAQALNFIKQPLTMIGNGLTFFGATLGFSGVGLLVMAAGVAISALGNSLHVNPTTGERGVKLTDKAAIQTGIGALTSVVGGTAFAGASEAISMGSIVMETAGKTVSVVGNALQSGIQYDAAGNYQGMDFSGFNGISAGLSVGTSIATGAITGAAGIADPVGQAVFGAAVGSALNTGVEYYKHTNWGAANSNYTALQRPDLGSFGGSLVGAALGAKFQEYGQKRVEAYKQDIANQANHADQQRRKAEILQGLGVRNEEELRRKFKSELFMDQTAQETNEFLQGLHAAGFDVGEMVQHTNKYRAGVAARAKSVQNAQAAAQNSWDYLNTVCGELLTDGGNLHADAVGAYRDRLSANREIDAEIRAEIDRAKRKGVRRGGTKVVPTYDELLSKKVPDPAQRAVFNKDRQVGFQDTDPYRGAKDRYKEALRIHSNTASRRLPSGADRSALKNQAVASFLTPEENRIFQDLVLPEYRELAGSEEATRIGRNQYLFGKQTTIAQATAGAMATSEWAIRGVTNFIAGREHTSWGDLYDHHYSDHRAKVTQFDRSMAGVYKSMNGANDPALAAAMESAFETDMARGAMQAEIGLAAFEGALELTPVGRVVGGARMAFRAARLGYTARSSVYIGAKAAYKGAAVTERLLQGRAARNLARVSNDNFGVIPEPLTLVAGPNHVHSRLEVLKEFAKQKHHTQTSLDIRRELVNGQFQMRLDEFSGMKAGGASGTLLRLRVDAHMHEKVSDLVHEGQHLLDIKNGVVSPLKSMTTKWQEALAEYRAYRAGIEFAVKNELRASIHWQLRHATDRELIDWIRKNYDIGEFRPRQYERIINYGR